MYDEAGRLLYIGQSNAPWNRPGQIAATHDWPWHVSHISVEWHGSRAAALAAEAAAIAAESPVHNITHHPAKPTKRKQSFGGYVLAKWLADRGMTVEIFAERCGVPASYVGRVIRCEIAPHTTTLRKFERVTGDEIPWQVWWRGGVPQGPDLQGQPYVLARELLSAAVPASAQDQAPSHS